MHTLKPIFLSSICFWGPMFVYFLMDCKIYFSYAALQFLYFHTNREVFSRRGNFYLFLNGSVLSFDKKL
jgi:hypothetical protein